MNTNIFFITFTQDVTFRDREDNILRDYKIGDVIAATHDNGMYFTTTMGGIYHEEARRLDGEELVTYTHCNGDGSVRFRQHIKDKLPPWARDLRIETAEAVEGDLEGDE